jgi:hypothetical protein
MNVLKIFFVMLAISSFTAVEAQTTTTEFTDEDLKKYAVTMDSVDAMKENVQKVVADMVQNTAVMSVARYNELFKIANDQAKLTEAKATPEEKAFLKEVENKRQEEIAKLNERYQSLAKDYVGLKKFNAIKKSIENDQAVKVKYETLSKELDTKGGE